MTAQIFTPILSNILMEHVGYRTLFPYAAFFAGRGRLSVFFPAPMQNGRRKGLSGGRFLRLF